MKKRLPFDARMAFCKNPTGKLLFQILHEKKTHLALSADVTRADDLLRLADQCGPEICVLKTHIDILEDFSLSLTKELVNLAKKHQFLIFEDRKFADIGSTVQKQYASGMYHIADWADIVNAHALPGPGIVEGLLSIGLKKNRGLLLLAEMSSKDNLFNAEYSQKTLKMAEQFPEFVMGFISQKKLSDDPQWIYMTPGVQLEEGKDALGQQYVTPERAIQNGADIIIVGRGILNAKDPQEAAKAYRKAANGLIR